MEPVMMESLMNRTKTLRSFFYLLTRNETTFEKVEAVPNYITEAIPLFVMLIILERVVLIWRGKIEWKMNDGISSMSAGMFSEMCKIMFSSGLLTIYTWVYTNYRMFDLAWDSAWTWWICFIAVDFGYYCFHRMSHEVNIVWAAHQVHHSSEYYNLTTALRQSALQNYFEFIYLPLALAIPPPIYVAHSFLNTLYQFWIHTCAVGRLGFVDYIINTPSNHRVHHGRNRYCIDKNYAAVFMIWDHLFGTYEAESAEVVYGLVHPLNDFNPAYTQFCHYMYIWKTFWETKGIGNKLSVLFKGPGWTPGQPRLGNIEDIPDISAPMAPYNPQQASWCSAYAIIHFAFLVFVYQEFALCHKILPITVMVMFTVFLFSSLVTIGVILDKKSYSPMVETVRCFVVAVLHRYFLSAVIARRDLPQAFHEGIGMFHLISGVLWAVQCKDMIRIHKWAPKQD